MPYASKAVIEYEFDVDHLNVWLTFRLPMDRTVMPAVDLWTVEVDTVDKPVSISEWIDEYTLLLTVPAVASTPDRVLVSYDGPSVNLRTTWDKQWQPFGLILGTNIGEVNYFVNRGDPAAFDFTLANFTTDENWHDLDLSSIVPAGAKAIALRVVVQVGTSWPCLFFRRKGNVNFIAVAGISSPLGTSETEEQVLCAVDSNRVVQYYAVDVSWIALNVVVLGWFF